jgi:DNA mismatch endonuclease (patch repair protein)
MGSIRGKNTVPELFVRRQLWRLGKRYRKHDRSVVGTPDISSKRKKVAVFIDGCFWHGCSKCYKEPTSNVSFWRRKLQYNKKRREQVTKILQAEKWTVVQYWEHEAISQPYRVAQEIARLM